MIIISLENWTVSLFHSLQRHLLNSTLHGCLLFDRRTESWPCHLVPRVRPQSGLKADNGIATTFATLIGS